MLEGKGYGINRYDFKGYNNHDIHPLYTTVTSEIRMNR